MPEISVIIPVYNRAHSINRAINSVLHQSFQDLEVVIVDDGSQDNLEEKLKEYDDVRVKFIKHDINKGAAAARNTGIQHSKGKYISFQDSDCLWLTDKLKKQLDVIIQNKVDFVFCNCIKVHGQDLRNILGPPINKELSHIQKSSLDKNKDFRGILRKTNVIDTPALFVRKDIMENVGGFDETLTALEDWDLAISLSQQYSFYYLNESLVISYYSDVSISNNKLANLNSHLCITKKHYDFFEKDRMALAKSYYRIGKGYFKIGQWQLGMNLLTKAIWANPLKLKYYIMLFRFLPSYFFQLAKRNS